jgi:hypothetical protein
MCLPELQLHTAERSDESCRMRRAREGEEDSASMFSRAGGTAENCFVLNNLLAPERMQRRVSNELFGLYIHDAHVLKLIRLGCNQTNKKCEKMAD